MNMNTYGISTYLCFSIYYLVVITNVLAVYVPTKCPTSVFIFVKEVLSVHI